DRLSLHDALPSSLNTTESLNYIELVTHSGPIVSAVLLLLVLSSVASWTIISRKVLHLAEDDGPARHRRKDEQQQHGRNDRAAVRHQFDVVEALSRIQRARKSVV